MGDLGRSTRESSPNGALIRQWIDEGGVVVTASDRAARALTAAYHRERLAEGLSAWPTPRILDWRSFVQSAFQGLAAIVQLCEFHVNIKIFCILIGFSIFHAG